MPLAIFGEARIESLFVRMQASEAHRLQLRKEHTAPMDKKLDDTAASIDPDLRSAKLQLGHAQDPEVLQARHAGEQFCNCSLEWDEGESA